MSLSESVQSPVFVVGTPRSGTTLTANVLGRHPHLLMPGENHFFETIYPRYQAVDLAADPVQRQDLMASLLGVYGHFNQGDDQALIDTLFADPDQRAALEKACENAVDGFSYLMSAQAKAAGKPRWGNNTPKDVFYAETIAKHFPSAQFVVCLRDPRDFCLSYKKRFTVTTEGHKDRLAQLYHPVLTAMLWLNTAKRAHALRAKLGPERVSVVRYEDLVTEPEACIEALCAQLGLTYEAQLLDVAGHNSSFEAGKSGIFSSSIGRYREHLDRSEIAAIQAVAGRLMPAFDYALEPGHGLGSALGHFATFPAGAWRALQANKAHRGPLWRYLIKRLLPGS